MTTTIDTNIAPETDKTKTPEAKVETRAAHPKKSLVPREKFAHIIQRNPYLDWILILTASFVLASALVAAGVYVYLDTGDRMDAPLPIVARGAASRLDLPRITGMLEEYAVQAETHRSLMRYYAAPADPSLP